MPVDVTSLNYINNKAVTKPKLKIKQAINNMAPKHARK